MRMIACLALLVAASPAHALDVSGTLVEDVDGDADLLDAERTLLEFQLTSARQLANTRIRAAELSALVLNNEPNSKGE